MILVMSDGKVAEYAPPDELLADDVGSRILLIRQFEMAHADSHLDLSLQKSLFYSLCQGAGIV